MFSTLIIDWCRNCASAVPRTPADISANNSELTTIVLVLGIVALVIYIAFALTRRG